MAQEVISRLKKEIERRRDFLYKRYVEKGRGCVEESRYDECVEILTFLNSLQEETPEHYTGKYDEAYLQEKIAKATKSWEGVDVDKYMDEVRGVETPEDLEEEMDRFFDEMPVQEHENIFEETFHNIARHFAEWGAEHLRDSTKMIGKSLDGAANEFANQDCVTFISRKKGFIAGAEWQKSQMLKDAVEGTMTNVGGSFGYDVLSAKYDDDHTITMCVPHEEGRKYGDKVRIVVMKEEGE